jgi:hypothetical protein
MPTGPRNSQPRRMEKKKKKKKIGSELNSMS